MDKAVAVVIGRYNLIVTSNGETYSVDQDFLSKVDELKKIRDELSELNINDKRFVPLRVSLLRKYKKLTVKKTDMILDIIEDIVSRYDKIYIQDIKYKDDTCSWIDKDVPGATYNTLQLFMKEKGKASGKQVSELDMDVLIDDIDDITIAKRVYEIGEKDG